MSAQKLFQAGLSLISHQQISMASGTFSINISSLQQTKCKLIRKSYTLCDALRCRQHVDTHMNELHKFPPCCTNYSWLQRYTMFTHTNYIICPQSLYLTAMKPIQYVLPSSFCDYKTLRKIPKATSSLVGEQMLQL